MADAAQVHARQVEYWNGEGAARWLANHSRRVDTARSMFADLALERASPRLGESVIEIGCGTGDASVELARRVGPAGAVLALDVSDLIGAQAKARLASLPNVRVAIGDAAAYPFEPRSADLLFSQFGVMFFGDPRAAFAHLRQALKPTGRLVFVCWRAPEPNPVLDIVFRHRPRPPATDIVEPGPQAFSDRTVWRPY
jgi:ubiquinone/menaquinone biosynthesis C-methylase UbiE